MTHDELVAWCRNHMTVRIPWRMVLAVLEIHKPSNVVCNVGAGRESKSVCMECSFARYPCPTVQAIEREVMR